MPADHTSPALLLDVKLKPGPFGAWLIPGNPFAHYFLAGAARCLCGEFGRPARAAVLPTSRSGSSGTRHPEGTYCPACAERNFARWAAAGSAPNGGG